VAQRFLVLNLYPNARKSQNSLLNSLIAGKSRGDGRDQHCVASQAVRQLEIVPYKIREVPANGGLIQIGAPSLDSQSLPLESEIGDSLRRMFEIFPFLGDCDRRPGSISTACPTRQSDSWPNSSTRKLVINVMSRSLRPVMGLQLDKVVAPDTHFSGSSDEPGIGLMSIEG
jgi:hypothetical protein